MGLLGSQVAIKKNPILNYELLLNSFFYLFMGKFFGSKVFAFRASCFDYFDYHRKGSLSMPPFSTLLGRRTFYSLYGRTMERKVDVLGLQI